MKHSSYADIVRPYTKSVVLGGALTLFPVPESLTQAYARTIQMAIRDAEARAYALGKADAQAEMRRSIGL